MYNGFQSPATAQPFVHPLQSKNLSTRVFDCRDDFIDPDGFNAVLAHVGGVTYFEGLGEKL